MTPPEINLRGPRALEAHKRALTEGGTRLDETKALCDSYGKKYSWSEWCKNLIDKMVSLLVNRQGI